MNALTLNIQTMSSREIATLCDKGHKNVMADIRNMCESLKIDSAEFSAQYKDSTGRTLPCFNLPKRESIILVYEWAVEQICYGLAGWELDKDIICKGNKLYSEETCAFVPSAINVFFYHSWVFKRGATYWSFLSQNKELLYCSV